MKSEKRSITTTYNSEGNRLWGYAAVWDSPTEIRSATSSFTEVIRKGAFTRSLGTNKDIISTYNHDVNQLLGRTSNNTLTILEDDYGLRFEVLLPDSPTGNEVRALALRGDLSGASFTFVPFANGSRMKDGVRELVDIEVLELGPVVMPAYEATSVGMRSKNYKYQLELRERL
jgi:uncharacterized protein